jgi:hypothetical protein
MKRKSNKIKKGEKPPPKATGTDTDTTHETINDWKHAS